MLAGDNAFAPKEQPLAEPIERLHLVGRGTDLSPERGIRDIMQQENGTDDAAQFAESTV